MSASWKGMAVLTHNIYRLMRGLGYLCEDPETIARIQCPILLMTGRPMMAPEQVKIGLATFKDNWQNGQHSHFEDGGHFIPFERFDRFIGELQVFFGAN